jgi:hypothetical protein
MRRLRTLDSGLPYPVIVTVSATAGEKASLPAFWASAAADYRG